MSAVGKCTSWLGHRFVPRYSSRPPNLSVQQIDKIWWQMGAERAALTRPVETYECDVCVRCGAVAALQHQEKE